MKKRNKLYTIAGAFALLTSSLLLTSCGSDYLSVSSGGQIEQDGVYSNTTSIRYAVNGLARMMSQQYKDVKWNGEGSIKTWYGNFLGNDYLRNN